MNIQSVDPHLAFDGLHNATYVTITTESGPVWEARINRHNMSHHPYQSWRHPVPVKADGGFGFY